MCIGARWNLIASDSATVAGAGRDKARARVEVQYEFCSPGRARALIRLSSLHAQLLDAAEIAELAEAVDDLHLAAAQRLGRLDRSQRQDHAALGSTKPAIGPPL